MLYKKHLLRGVAKGAFTLEAAEQKFAQWVEEHKNKVLDHERKHHKDKSEIAAKLLEQEQKKASDREAKRAAALAAKEAEAAPAEETTEEAPAADATETPAEN